jgi:hypothetical protein
VQALRCFAKIGFDAEALLSVSTPRLLADLHTLDPPQQAELLFVLTRLGLQVRSARKHDAAPRHNA